MNHTKNYQLSQWEMEDRLLMEDFNGDNAKVDAALKAQADALAAQGRQLAEVQSQVGLRLLFTRRLGSTQSDFHASLQGINWSKYAVVHIAADIKQDGRGVMAWLKGGGQTITVANGQYGGFQVVLFPCGRGSRALSGFALTSNGSFIQRASMTYDQLTELHMQTAQSNLPILAGSTVSVYGQ